MLFCLQLSLKCSQVYVYLQLQLISSLLPFFKQETNYIRSCKSTSSFFFFSSFFSFFGVGSGRSKCIYLQQYKGMQSNHLLPLSNIFAAKHCCSNIQVSLWKEKKNKPTIMWVFFSQNDEKKKEVNMQTFSVWTLDSVLIRIMNKLTKEC